MNTPLSGQQPRGRQRGFSPFHVMQITNKAIFCLNHPPETGHTDPTERQGYANTQKTKSEIGVPVEKLHQQGIAEFDIEYVDMHPEDGLWSDLFD